MLNLIVLTIVLTAITTYVCLTYLVPILWGRFDPNFYNKNGKLSVSKVSTAHMKFTDDDIVLKYNGTNIHMHIPSEYRLSTMPVQASDPQRLFDIRLYDRTMQKLSQGDRSEEVVNTAIDYRDAFLVYDRENGVHNIPTPFKGASNMIDQILKTPTALTFWRPPLPWLEYHKWIRWLLIREGSVRSMLAKYSYVINQLRASWQDSSWTKDAFTLPYCSQCNIEEVCENGVVEKQSCSADTNSCRFVCAKNMPQRTSRCTSASIIERIPTLLISALVENSRIPNCKIVKQCATTILREVIRESPKLLQLLETIIC